MKTTRDKEKAGFLRPMLLGLIMELRQVSDEDPTSALPGCGGGVGGGAWPSSSGSQGCSREAPRWPGLQWSWLPAAQPSAPPTGRG